ncbi:hypothetical protein BU17DRAFT_37816 [Hysterangium stoloniferum]|nr:hypothetical protein BU17DRAFT_37816 [Hysterangium stoloniferum]
MSDAPPAPVIENGVSSQTQPATEETPGHKVFAGNLAYSTTDEGLRAFFESAATDIISAQVIQRGTRSAGYGFIAFASLEAAEKAVAALDKKELDGRALIIEIAKPTEQKDKERTERRAKRRAGRRGSKAPPGEVTEAEANGDADKPDGAAANSAEPAKPKKKRNRKKAKKVVKDVAGETAATTTTDAPATAANGEAPKKKTPRPARKRTPRPAGEPPVGEPSKTVLFVANLGFNIDDAQLTELFTSNGIAVSSARVVRKRWGTPRKSKGYGFVDVGSEEEQKKALAALQGKEVDGREIAVKIAVNAQEREDGAENVEGAAALEAAALEEESRREGLSKSLFEKAREEEQTGGPNNKAMAMMLKASTTIMGYKPGQSLGQAHDEEPTNPKPEEPAEISSAAPERPPPLSGHLVEPLPLDVWSGRLGVGKRKRAASPTAAAKLAKMVHDAAAAAEEHARGSYRERARQEYEERRAEGRLVSATRTCVALDETAGEDFNVFWLNPRNPDGFPPALLAALTADSGATDDALGPSGAAADPVQLRKQMQADALQPLDDLQESGPLLITPSKQSEKLWPPDLVAKARTFIHSDAQTRLKLLVEYLRSKYLYCFWCGTQYTDSEDLLSNCPGLEEEDHD